MCTHLLPPAVCGKGNVFSRVCLSVCYCRFLSDRWVPSFRVYLLWVGCLIFVIEKLSWSSRTHRVQFETCLLTCPNQPHGGILPTTDGQIVAEHGPMDPQQSTYQHTHTYPHISHFTTITLGIVHIASFWVKYDFIIFSFIHRWKIVSVSENILTWWENMGNVFYDISLPTPSCTSGVKQTSMQLKNWKLIGQVINVFCHCYHLQMWEGNVFSHVCLSVSLFLPVFIWLLGTI